MSTQYDTIQAPYDYIRKKSIALIEHENVHTTVAPFIKNARVLDLACGSGFYTYSFLQWGASAVVGVDISPTMIEEARRLGGAASSPSSSTNESSANVSFILADCAKPTAYPGGPFDLVFGAWLLNYAPDRPALVDMYRNISLNLKPGGHFVSVTVEPAMDPTASVDAKFKARPPPQGSGGFVSSKSGDVEEGISIHVHGGTVVGDVDFDCFHLRRDVYEEAAGEAGLRGGLRWGGTRVPERWLRGEGGGGASLEELVSYEKVPGYGVLVVAK